jgi:hypothetical protein
MRAVYSCPTCRAQVLEYQYRCDFCDRTFNWIAHHNRMSRLAQEQEQIGAAAAPAAVAAAPRGGAGTAAIASIVTAMFMAGVWVVMTLVRMALSQRRDYY